MPLEFKEKIDFKQLDCLRGMAAFYVMVNHARGYLFPGGNVLAQDGLNFLEKVLLSIYSLTRIGKEFVIVFFVLSGFSIAFSLSRKSTLREFYLRRFIRLYPPYIAGLFWALIVFYLYKSLNPDFFSGVYNSIVFDQIANSERFGSLTTVIQNLFYYPSGLFIFQYWSLPHEALFYLLAPILCWQPIGFLLAAFLLHFLFLVQNGVGHQNDSILLNFIFIYFLYFMIGICSFRFWNFILLSFSRFKQSHYQFFLVSLFLIMILINLYFSIFTQISGFFACVFTIIMMAYVHQYPLRNKFLNWLGKQSYSLYISHVASILLVFLLAFSLGFYNPPYINSWVFWILGIPVSLVVSYFIYLLIERPCLNLIKNLRSPKRLLT